MRDLLREFLADWLAWAESENLVSPLGVEYDTTCGLCSCTYQFTEVAKYPGPLHPVELAIVLQDRLIDAFDESGLGAGYPFGVRAYDKAARFGSMHKDQNRLDWVRRQLEK